MDEARFALGSALRLRPDDPAIRDALETCLARLVEHEIEVRSPAGARSFLEEMRAAPPELVLRVDALEHAIAAEKDAREEVERARREADSSISLRAMMGIFAALLAAIVPVWLLFAPDDGREGMSRLMNLGWGICVVVVGAGLALGRRTLFATESSRRIVGFFVVLLGSVTATSLVLGARGATLVDLVVDGWCVCASVCAVGAILLMPELWIATVVYSLGVALLFAVPDRAIPVEIVVVTINVGVFVWAMRAHARRSRVSPAGATGSSDRARSAPGR